MSTHLRCGSDDAGEGPRDGSMWHAAEGQSVPFAGSVADAHGVSEVRVNGQVVTVDGAGAFATSLTARFGVNIVDIVARDAHGAENTRLLYENDEEAIDRISHVLRHEPEQVRLQAHLRERSQQFGTDRFIEDVRRIVDDWPGGNPTRPA